MEKQGVISTLNGYMLLLSMLSEKQKQKNICSKYLTDLERVFVCLVG